MANKITSGVLLLTGRDYDPLVEQHFFTGTKKQVNKAIDAVIKKWCYKYLDVRKEQKKQVKEDTETYWEESDDKDEMRIQIIRSFKITDFSED